MHVNLGAIYQLHENLGINEADNLRYCRGKDPKECGRGASCFQNQCVPHGKKTKDRSKAQ